MYLFANKRNYTLLDIIQMAPSPNDTTKFNTTLLIASSTLRFENRSGNLAVGINDFSTVENPVPESSMPFHLACYYHQ
ncbi:hypothetical protein NPIL_373791 [Nephila pilipes]|uniref:Uncharacterized protein n=1 Tax=Nephila pilipes TaxID=299642 RepID=A0A8X6TRT6_NEPPI|nr:hypothetical protein NPIL_373791 [Nephila pilipes]